MPEEFLVDLQRPPEERWGLTDALCDEARRLAEMYIKDVGVPEDTAAILGDMAKLVMPENYWQELEAIAGRLSVPTASIFVCNAYYDLIKSVLGCTAFAVETGEGPIGPLPNAPSLGARVCSLFGHRRAGIADGSHQ